MEKVIVGMSGGVDSAVAALLLKNAGYEVVGVTLRTWESSDSMVNRCCEIDDARRAAFCIGIPYYPVNCEEAFAKYVTEPFIDEYISGRTPSPCLGCNRHIKWDEMLRVAEMLGARYIATGHYARVVTLGNGRLTVRVAKAADKDQTYMLSLLTQEQLARTLMPLGEYTKAEVREIAREAGIPVAGKADSQEICFVPDGDYAAFIEENAPDRLRGPGSFVDEDGNVLGEHRGIIRYTVGQRKGLGLAMGQPVYVNRIDPERNEVVIGDEASVMKKTVICADVNYMSVPEPAPGESLRAIVKVRYRHRGGTASIVAEPSGGARIEFDAPVKAPSPGQYAVFYDEDGDVIGGGRITDAF